MNYKIEILFDDAKVNLKETKPTETEGTLFHLCDGNDSSSSGTSKIGLMDSVKSAIVCDVYVPDYTWMATGSLSNMNNNHLLPIKNRTIVAFPKKGEYDICKRSARILNDMGYNITVSKYMENVDMPDNSDLSDLFASFASTVLT